MRHTAELTVVHIGQSPASVGTDIACKIVHAIRRLIFETRREIIPKLQRKSLGCGECCLRVTLGSCPITILFCESQVIQRRLGDTAVNFNQPWPAYAAGFGSPTGDFWLGDLDIMYSY